MFARVLASITSAYTPCSVARHEWLRRSRRISTPVSSAICEYSSGTLSSALVASHASWSPDSSVENMRQVDFDFLEQRVNDDEFRQFQRSEFDGSDQQQQLQADTPDF